MGDRALALSRARVGALVLGLGAFAALSMGASSCTATNAQTVTVSGTSLTIYASDPSGVPGAQDTFNAEQLALHDSGGTIGKFTVKLVRLDVGELSAHARAAVEDKSTIAYLGEDWPGAARASLGITNAVDILQVSPGDTALELTQATPAVPGSPGRYYESSGTYGRTFARVVPSTALEAKAQVQEMQALGVKRLYISSDGTQYGAAIAYALRQDATAAAITVLASPTGADGAFYGAASAAVAGHEFDTLSQSNPAIKLFAPSAVASGLRTTATNVYVSQPGFLPKNLTPAGSQFVSSFTSRYGHPPAAGAIFGYEAMKAVLDVLREAGNSANSRSVVVADFFAIHNRSSVLGTYSIDSNGDTNLGPFVFSRLRGRTLVPFKFVQVQS